MKLVEQYSNVIKPPTQLLERLKINSDEPFKVNLKVLLNTKY
jgi:hypothetical protein